MQTWVTDKQSQIPDDLVEGFLSHPENYMLYRGEKEWSRGGIHFTTDIAWAKNFGQTILEGKLPTGCKIKLIERADFDNALRRGITNDGGFYEAIFADGYEVILGYDPMNCAILDVIVHPKYLSRFRDQKSTGQKFSVKKWSLGIFRKPYTFLKSYFPGVETTGNSIKNVEPLSLPSDSAHTRPL